jgi:hypothetical protein
MTASQTPPTAIAAVDPDELARHVKPIAEGSK